MVQANPDKRQELSAMFAQVAFQRIPDTSGWGKPDAPSQAVEDLKKTKGKMFSDNTKNLPAEVKAIA